MIDKPITVTTFQRGSRANYLAQWKDPVSGKVRQRSTGHTVRRDAERFAARLEKELNDGLAGASRATWAEFRERAERDFLPTVRDATADKYRTAMTKVEAHLRPKLLTELTPEKLGRLAAALRKEPGRGGKPKSAASVASNMRHLKALLNWAHRQGMLPKKPLVDIPKGEVSAKGRPLTDEEFDRMLDAVPGVVGDADAPKWVRLLRGLWLSGLRLSEAMGLTWGDRDGIRVRLDGKFPAVFIPGRLQKGRKDTVTPLTPDLVDLLEETPETDRTGFVFDPPPMRGGDRPDWRWVGKVIGRIGEASGVDVKAGKHPTAHDLRRSFCFRWAQQVLPQQLRTLARHASVTTTLEYYAEADAGMTAEAVAAAVARRD